MGEVESPRNDAGSRSQKLITGDKQKYVSLSSGIICDLTAWSWSNTTAFIDSTAFVFASSRATMIRVNFNWSFAHIISHTLMGTSATDEWLSYFAVVTTSQTCQFFANKIKPQCHFLDNYTEEVDECENFVVTCISMRHGLTYRALSNFRIKTVFQKSLNRRRPALINGRSNILFNNLVDKMRTPPYKPVWSSPS